MITFDFFSAVSALSLARAIARAPAPPLLPSPLNKAALSSIDVGTRRAPDTHGALYSAASLASDSSEVVMPFISEIKNLRLKDSLSVHGTYTGGRVWKDPSD